MLVNSFQFALFLAAVLGALRSFRRSRRLGTNPTASLTALHHTHPNAGQRRMTTEFIEEENVPPIARIALLTDSELLRGAMTAFNWIQPKSRFRAYGVTERAKALVWLREIAEFDARLAATAWLEAREWLRAT